MKRSLSTLRLVVAPALFAGLALALITCLARSAEQSEASPTTSEKPLKKFLQEYDSPYDTDKTTRYVRSFVDLNGDGKKEVVVYLIGSGWCGTGGCRTLILAPDHSTYRLITRIYAVHPPVIVLASTSHGWRSLAVWVVGGGILEGYEAELRFDGRTYPINPAIPPAQRLAAVPSGTVIVSRSDEGTPLYP